MLCLPQKYLRNPAWGRSRGLPPARRGRRLTEVTSPLPPGKGDRADSESADRAGEARLRPALGTRRQESRREKTIFFPDTEASIIGQTERSRSRSVPRFSMLRQARMARKTAVERMNPHWAMSFSSITPPNTLLWVPRHMILCFPPEAPLGSAAIQA